MATGFGRSLATLSTTTSASANFKADASAPASGSMLVAQAIVNNLQVIATPSGYTALPSNPTTLAAHHIYVFYKIADGVETSVTLTWGANNNCAMYTRYYTTPAYTHLVEITSAVAAGAASDMKVTMTADAPASGLGLLAMLFHDGSHWYDGGLTQFGGSTFTHENASQNWNGNANGTMGSDDITSLPASTVRYGCGWHYAFGSFSAASVAGKILAIAPIVTSSNVAATTSSTVTASVTVPKTAPRSYTFTSNVSASTTLSKLKPVLASVTGHVSALVTAGAIKRLTAAVTCATSLVGLASRAFLVFANVIAHTSVDAKRRHKQKHPNSMWPPYDDPQFEFLGDKP